jgi:hypothetical protein
MGYVVGLVLFLFPEDTLFTVDSFVVHEGPRRSILLEVASASSDPIRICIETDLAAEPGVELPIQRRVENPFKSESETYAFFAWKGWVANQLQLTLSRFGASCTQEFLDACSNLLVAAAPEIGPQRSAINQERDPDASPESEDVHLDGIQALLGEYPLERMEFICREVLLASPSAHQMHVEKALGILASVL